MNELSNCPNCNAIFVKSKFRDVCETCYKEEEKQFDDVYQFIRKRENRTATIEQVVEETGVEEELILKFIKSGRLRISGNPNLGYPCEKCGTPIRDGRLCKPCTNNLNEELKRFERNEDLRKHMDQASKQPTYYTQKR